MIANKKFNFKNVITFNPVYTFFIAIPLVCFWGYLYYLLTKGNFYLGLVMLFTGFYFATVLGLLKLISSNITIWFDDNYMYVQKGNNRFEKYKKSEIEGFYSYDYETKTPSLKSSITMLKLYLTNKKIVYLNDIDYRNKYEEEKGDQLRRFLQSTQIELNFEKIKKKKLQNIYWYSKN